MYKAYLWPIIQKILNAPVIPVIKSLPANIPPSAAASPAILPKLLPSRQKIYCAPQRAYHKKTALITKGGFCILPLLHAKQAWHSVLRIQGKFTAKERCKGRQSSPKPLSWHNCANNSLQHGCPFFMRTCQSLSKLTEGSVFPL